MRDLASMSVLITGGGSGLGEGAARHFAAKGARVTISGRRAEKLDAVAADIGDLCRPVAGDITGYTSLSFTRKGLRRIP